MPLYHQVRRRRARATRCASSVGAPLAAAALHGTFSDDPLTSSADAATRHR
jgi:hypothetical protein